ncbi:toll/interleukin-1 receptor domain-containing protein [Buchananella felis]|uniref:toll/interleukin-1 receptor domain-containing protein n=1 Tax=Buchananella felis TaxID=3231492 RepID=UPI00352941F5
MCTTSETQHPQEIEVAVFLSYAREDENHNNFIRHFKESLTYFAKAKYGIRIKAFLDQESIEWGEIWKSRLEAEVVAASVFIPFLSANYLNSENCRKEYNLYLSATTESDVPELILPIVLFNSPKLFRPDSDDDIARQSADRQWIIIEDAILAGAGTAEWRKTMSMIAERFYKSYNAAVTKLSLAVTNSPGPKGGAPIVESESPSPASTTYTSSSDAPGLFDELATLEEQLKELTSIIAEGPDAIKKLGDAASIEPDPQVLSSAALKTWSFGVAEHLKGPANKIGDIGEKMFATTMRVHASMRNVREIAIEYLPGDERPAKSYNESIQPLADLGNVAEQMNSLLESMRPAERSSAAIRRALSPARSGVAKIRDSINLIESLPPIEL